MSIDSEITRLTNLRNSLVTKLKSMSLLSGAETLSNCSTAINSITKKTSSDLTASGASVTIPQGYYSSSASKSISNGSVTINTPTVSSTGLVTSTATTTAGYISSAPASKTLQLTTKAAATITPSTSNQTISSGTYLTGAQTIVGDSNLIASNIKNGVTIFGVTGTYAPTVETKSFSYTGGIQTYSVEVDGLYKFEIYGARGGQSLCNGSLYGVYAQGGYAVGYQRLTAGETLYIGIGGAGAHGPKGANAAGGYNGGGNGTWDGSDDESGGAGGGCTHIAKMTGTLATIGASNISKVLIVAGGGGGASWHTANGVGGGTTAGQCGDGRKATTSSGYAFGQGQNASGAGASDGQGGGGGGLYGGYEPSGSGETVDYGGGGSGYIGGCLSSVTYDGKTYTSSTTNGGGTGNGSAIISFIGP